MFRPLNIFITYKIDMSIGPFSSNGVTSADIQSLKDLIKALDTKVEKGFSSLLNKITPPIATFSTPTLSSSKNPVMSGDILPPTPSVKDVSNIFLGKGGSRGRRKSKKTLKLRRRK